MAGKPLENLIKAKEAARHGQPYAIVPPPLPACASALPLALQQSAQHYLRLRRQSGESLLAAVRLLSEARTAAEHGDWGIYLETIGLDESRARAQIRIHEKAESDPTFAEHVRSGLLSEAVARELLPASPEVQQEVLSEVLSRGTPPTLRDVRTAKRASTPALPPAEPPAPPSRSTPAPAAAAPWLATACEQFHATAEHAHWCAARINKLSEAERAQLLWKVERLISGTEALLEALR